jgi:putative tricarboxylic transport membrane protein
MDALNLLMGGFATALQPNNLLFALLGSVLGTMVGIMPGIGPVAGTALLLPLTFKLDPTASIIMLCAIYYGAMYGGTLTSVSHALMVTKWPSEGGQVRPWRSPQSARLSAESWQL